MGSGIDFESAAQMQRAQQQARYMNYTGSTAQATNPQTEQALLQMKTNNEDIMSLSHNSGCTDGKDDGKIGLFGAVGNALKGVGKSIVNGIKGCFTDSEGKFSLGKTLLTVGMGALCVAFPAVGLVACGFGAVAGGVQVAKGVGKAMSAETDAEAKEAWQNIGAGGFTVASSVVGAKASVGAVKSTSTAGLSGLDDAAAAVAKAEGKTSALSQLDDSLTGMEKVTKTAQALGKDMLSSTKNNGKFIINTVKNDYSNVKTAQKDLSKVNEGYSKEQAKAIKEYDKIQAKRIKAKADGQEIPDGLKTDSKNIIAELKKAFDTDDDGLKEIIKIHKDAQKALVDAKKETVFGQAKQTVTDKLHTMKENKKAAVENHKALVKDLKDANKTLREAKKTKNEDAIKTATDGVKAAKSALIDDNKIASTIQSIKDGGITKIPSSISQKGKEILIFLQKEEGTYAAAVQKFGYDNVLGALEVFAAMRMTDEAV